MNKARQLVERLQRLDLIILDELGYERIRRVSYRGGSSGRDLELCRCHRLAGSQMGWQDWTCARAPTARHGEGDITNEDDADVVNLVVWPDVFEKWRQVIAFSEDVAHFGACPKGSRRYSYRGPVTGGYVKSPGDRGAP
jgi:hypothetical protein